MQDQVAMRSYDCFVLCTPIKRLMIKVGTILRKNSCCYKNHPRETSSKNVSDLYLTLLLSHNYFLEV